MKTSYLLKLAVRNLMAHRLRSTLTLIGVVIGISAVVFLVAFGFGIQRLVTQQITGGDAFQLLDIGTGNSKIVKLNSEMIDKVRSISGVKSVETIVNLAGKAKKDDSETDISFFATTANYFAWSGRKIRYGQMFTDDNNEHKVVVNNACVDFLADKGSQDVLGKKIRLTVIVPKELAVDGEEHIFDDQEYEIIGVIKEDAPPSIYSSLSDAAIFDIKNYSQAKVWLASKDIASVVRQQIESFGLKTHYIGDTVNQVEQVFAIFKIILASFGIIALLVALLGMFNTLTVSLLERTRELALMKILGIGRRDVLKLFISEALILGVVGGTMGVISGVLSGFLANGILNYFAVRAGGDRVAVFYYPYWFIILIIFIAIFISLITGLYPAKRASRVNPLDVLRYE